MISELRKKQILELLKRDGIVFTKDLSNIFKVSTMTIRRDLKDLEDAGYLKRIYKGAILEELGTELSFRERMTKNKKEKERIAERAIRYIANGDFIALSGGSTTFQLALLLTKSTIRDLTIITNSLNIAVKLTERKDFNVIVAGGPVREKSYECIGDSVIYTVKQYNINKFFMGINGISLKKGISMSNVEEAQVARALISRSLMNIVVCDHSKVDQVKMGYVCPLNQIDLFIMDKKVPSSFRMELEKSKLHAEFV